MKTTKRALLKKMHSFTIQGMPLLVLVFYYSVYFKINNQDIGYSLSFFEGRVSYDFPIFPLLAIVSIVLLGGVYLEQKKATISEQKDNSTKILFVAVILIILFMTLNAVVLQYGFEIFRILLHQLKAEKLAGIWLNLEFSRAIVCSCLVFLTAAFSVLLMRRAKALTYDARKARAEAWCNALLFILLLIAYLWLKDADFEELFRESNSKSGAGEWKEFFRLSLIFMLTSCYLGVFSLDSRLISFTQNFSRIGVVTLSMIIPFTNYSWFSLGPASNAVVVSLAFDVCVRNFIEIYIIPKLKRQ